MITKNISCYNLNYDDIYSNIYDILPELISSIIEIKINNKIIYCYTILGLFLRILDIINDGALIIKHTTLNCKTVSFIKNLKSQHYYILKKLDFGFIKPSNKLLLIESFFLANIFNINISIKLLFYHHNKNNYNNKYILNINNSIPTYIIDYNNYNN